MMNNQHEFVTRKADVKLVDDSGEYQFGIIDHKGKNLFMDTIMLKYTYERA